MPEFPDSNTGGLNPFAPGPQAPSPPVSATGKPTRARIRIYLLLGFFGFIVLAMGVGGGFCLVSAFRPGHTWADRLMSLLYACGLCAPLVIGIRGYITSRIQIKLHGGSTPESRRAYAAQSVRQCSTKAAAAQSNIFAYAIKWASYAAMQPSLTAWQRAAAWLVLALYTAAVLVVVALGVVMAGAGLDTFSTGGWAIAALGLGVFVWPVIVVRRLIRGIRAGRVGTTREEFEQVRAGHDAWRRRESAKPLRDKLLSSGLGLAIFVLWGLRSQARHPGDRSSWIGPVVTALLLLYPTWIPFRKPKGPAQDSASSDPAAD